MFWAIVKTRNSAYLAGGQTPRLRKDLLEEGRLDAKVTADNVEAEKVPVDALPAHRIPVEMRVVLAGYAKGLDAIFTLQFRPFLCTLIMHLYK